MLIIRESLRGGGGDSSMDRRTLCQFDLQVYPKIDDPRFTHGELTALGHTGLNPIFSYGSKLIWYYTYARSTSNNSAMHIGKLPRTITIIIV